jgi:hypothetical protein
MSRRIIIIPCGFKKRTGVHKAVDLYIGPYFKSNLRWARNYVKDSDILILSAKHGLLDLDRVILPYDLKMGETGDVSVESLKLQAEQRGIVDYEVFALGGKTYTDKLEKIFNNISLPMKGLSLGYAMQRVKQDILNGVKL